MFTYKRSTHRGAASLTRKRWMFAYVHLPILGFRDPLPYLTMISVTIHQWLCACQTTPIAIGESTESLWANLTEGLPLLDGVPWRKAPGSARTSYISTDPAWGSCFVGSICTWEYLVSERKPVWITVWNFGVPAFLARTWLQIKCKYPPEVGWSAKSNLSPKTSSFSSEKHQELLGIPVMDPPGCEGFFVALMFDVIHGDLMTPWWQKATHTPSATLKAHHHAAGRLARPNDRR